MFKIYFIGLKKRVVWVVLDIEEIRGKDNENRFEKREEVIEMSIYSAFPYTRCTRSFAF